MVFGDRKEVKGLETDLEENERKWEISRRKEIKGRR